MGSIDRPSKEQVRAWLSQRVLQALPPPTGDQIRRQLGWEYHAPRPAWQRESPYALALGASVDPESEAMVSAGFKA